MSFDDTLETSASSIAEARTGKSWEDPIREQVFTPLGWGVKLEPDGSPLFLTQWEQRLLGGGCAHHAQTQHHCVAGDEPANQAIQDIGNPLQERLKPLIESLSAAAPATHWPTKAADRAAALPDDSSVPVLRSRHPEDRLAKRRDRGRHRSARHSSRLGSLRVDWN